RPHRPGPIEQPEPMAQQAPAAPPPAAANPAVRPLQELLEQLHSTESGLTTADAAAILERTGPNHVASARHATLLADLFKRLGNPLVLILLFAATVSGFTGDIPSF